MAPSNGPDGSSEAAEDLFSGMPDKLVQEVKKLESMLQIDKDKLKGITDHFVGELTKGLSIQGGNLPMNLTWVMGRPTGDETGTYLTLDMGGTHVRVCKVTLKGEGLSEVDEKPFPMPDELKSGSADELWGYLADCVKQFIEEKELDQDGVTHQLAFTFSFPVTQGAINHGVLQRWTKGFDVKGVEGKNVVEQFSAALREKNVPVNIAVLINDTTGTLLASVYNEPKTEIGSILGTGCNSAYFEHCRSIPKLLETNPSHDRMMAINCEYGAFDNEHAVLPRTQYDIVVDEESPRPGQQSYEKMSSGLYVGEIFRHILLDLHSRKLLFVDQDVPALKESQSIGTDVLSRLDNQNPSDVRDVFQPILNIDMKEEELRLCHHLTVLLNIRAARLCSCGLAAICQKRDLQACYVGADGAALLKNERQKERLIAALVEVLEWSHFDEPPVQLNAVEGGSSVGAAIAAAMMNKGYL